MVAVDSIGISGRHGQGTTRPRRSPSRFGHRPPTAGREFEAASTDGGAGPDSASRHRRAVEPARACGWILKAVPPVPTNPREAIGTLNVSTGDCHARKAARGAEP